MLTEKQRLFREQRRAARAAGQPLPMVPRGNATIIDGPKPGDRLIEIIHRRYHVPPCQGCVKTAQKMNENGLEWCRQNIKELGQELKANAHSRTWTAVISAAVEAVRGDEFYEGLVIEACDACEPIRRDESLCTIGPQTFEPITRRHLLCHIYPIKGSAWTATADTLRENIDLFNGRRVVAIAMDGHTETVDVVKKYLAGLSIQFHAVTNDPSLWEVNTAKALFMLVRSTAHNEAVFYCHAKGVTKPPDATSHHWRDVMFSTLLYWSRVSIALERYPVVGAFKKVGRGFPQSSSDWHYSGSFFWARSDEFYRRNWTKIDRFKFGIEAFPSLHFSSAEAGCMLYEAASEEMNLYEKNYWTEVIDDIYQRYNGNIPATRSCR